MDNRSSEQRADGLRKPESASELTERLMRFYGVDSLTALIVAQHRHVEKLQDRLPMTGPAAANRVREG